MTENEAAKLRTSFRSAWHMEDAYGWVFLLLLIDISLLITLPAASWAKVLQVPFVAMTLVLGLRTSAASPRVLKWGQIGAVMAVMAVVALTATGTDKGTGLIYLVMAALLVVTPFVMLRRLLTRSKVTGRVLIGALSVYLMIGLFFSFLFLGLAWMNDGVFFNQLTTTEPTDYVYFSYITMLTIGYGDFTPATELGKLLSIMDGLLGQVFLVTTVARLVALYGGFRGPEDPAKETTETT